MKIRLSKDVVIALQEINRKDHILITRINKQLKLFQESPHHPSLRTHKLTGKLQNRWSISITMGIRMIYIIVKRDEAYFVAIGTHDMVYRK